MSGDYRVVLEGAVRVAGVESADEAVSVAVSKSGSLLNPDLDYVTISPSHRSCRDCDGDHDPVFVVAGDALVALEYELTIFDADSEEHATRIARGELGAALENIGLEVADVEPASDATDDGSDDDTLTLDDRRDRQLPEFKDLATA
jgi:uncharacterized protein (UPF0212 family)